MHVLWLIPMPTRIAELVASVKMADGLAPFNRRMAWAIAA